MTLLEKTEQQSLLTIAYRDYERGLNSYAFFKIHDHAVSENLVQDTFMKTWKYLVEGGRINLMKAFLYHILNNLIVDEYRKHKTTSLDTLIEKGYEPSIDDSEHILNSLDGSAALLLIKQLPLKYRDVMQMKYVKMLTLNEISSVTHQSKNTIAVQAHRGLEKLRLLYNPV